LAKYSRFPDHTTAMEDKKFRDHVVEEVADVHIIMQHLYMIFKLDPKEVEDAMDLKLGRMSRWLKNDVDNSHTMVDRELTPIPLEVIKGCGTCAHYHKISAWTDFCCDCNGKRRWKQVE